jgi:hypothetical protein
MRETARRRQAAAMAANAATAPAAFWGSILPLAALASVLVLVTPGTASAQALGTMQVTARVVPASVAWSGLALAGAAARAVAAEKTEQPMSRRTGLVYVRVEPPPSGSGGPLIVTVHHPHN